MTTTERVDENGTETAQDGTQEPAQRAQAPEDARDIQDAQDGATDGGDDATDDEGDDAGRAKLRGEAKSLRGRLRDTEAERDTLRDQLDSLRRAEVVRHATGENALADGGDLERAGVQVADLLGDDGTVDPVKVGVAVQKVLADRPHWAHRPPTRPRPDPSQGVRGAAPDGSGWADVLRGAKR